MAGIPFGREMRKEFLMGPGVIPLNHGSWGAVPRRVFDARIENLREIESAGDLYHRYHEAPYWYENLKAVCEFLNLDFTNTTFIPNATTGINTILKNLPMKEGDAILTYNYTYAAVHKTALSTASKFGLQVVCMDIPYRIKSREYFIEQFEENLDRNPNVKVAVIDYISSSTATLFPVKELCAVCRLKNVISVIDGAHAPGHVKLDMEHIQPDFFVGNLHKWVYSPKGTAIMWMDKKYHGIIRPLVTSHNYQKEPFQKEFQYQATLDQSNYNVTQVAVKFYKEIGGIDAVQEYVTKLLDEAVEYLVDLWGTNKFPIPTDMEAPFMRLIRVPALPNFPIPDRHKTAVVARQHHPACVSPAVRSRRPGPGSQVGPFTRAGRRASTRTVQHTRPRKPTEDTQGEQTEDDEEEEPAFVQKKPYPPGPPPPPPAAGSSAVQG